MIASWFKIFALCPLMDFTKSSNFLTPLTFLGMCAVSEDLLLHPFLE